MRNLHKFAVVALALGGALASHAAETAQAAIVNVEGEKIGDAVFEQAPSGVIVHVRVTGLPPGAKGVHLHSVGACAPDFSAAKGHINPEGRRHGLRGEMPDNGDLPNLHIAADGTATAEFFHQRIRVSAAEGDPLPPLLDEDGSAIVIHAAPDDHETQPIGGAGGRIGCGVIEAAEAQ